MADLFLEEGASVAISDINGDGLDAAVKELSGYGTVLGINGDVRSMAAAGRMVMIAATMNTASSGGKYLVGALDGYGWMLSQMASRKIALDTAGKITCTRTENSPR